METVVILLDTSILIEVLRRKDKSSSLFYTLALTGETLAVSAVTVYEFRNGMTMINQELCERLLSRLIILPFDDETAKTASSIYRTLKRESKLIDTADILIAATALTHSIPFATLNVKHFQRIAGLSIFTP